MRIGLGVPFSDTTVTVRELESDVYIVIGKESEICLYPTHTQSKQAQIRQLKGFTERLWHSLNALDDEPEAWIDADLTELLNQDAVEEEMPWAE